MVVVVGEQAVVVCHGVVLFVHGQVCQNYLASWHLFDAVHTRSILGVC